MGADLRREVGLSVSGHAAGDGGKVVGLDT